MGNPPKPAVEPITKEQGSEVCGTAASLPRLKLGKGNGVQNAFVFLEGVKAGARMKPQQSVLVDQKDCQYVPHALAVPVGTRLEFTNSDSILHSAVGRQDGPEGPQTLFNIAQPVKGARNLIEKGLTRPGVVVLTCDAGHPWMFAYVFVADHPHVAVTKSDGDFVIENVPVGTYKIRMWHEGVTIRKIHKQLQIFEYEEPYEIEKEVVVTADAEAIIDFDLTLR
jgi:plastocyanin